MIYIYNSSKCHSCSVQMYMIHKPTQLGHFAVNLALSFREDNFLTIKFAMIKFKAGRPNLRLVKKQTFRRQNLRLLEEKAEDKI